MRKLASLCIVTVFVLLAVLSSAALHKAHADCTIHEHDLTSRVEAWANAVTKASNQYSDALGKAAVLNVKTPPPPDVQAQVKELLAKMASAKETINRETTMLKLDIMRLTCDTPDTSQGLKLAGFLNEIIKAKGIPLTKTMSVLPNFTWNIKTGTLGSFGGTLTVRFNNP